jgi:hypothetical protein
MKAVLDAMWLLLLALGGDGAASTTRRSSSMSSKPLDPTSAPPSLSASPEPPKYDEETTYALHWDELLLAEHRERVADFLERRKTWSRKR